MSDQARQTLTFLFTDIEGSTRLIQELGERYTELLEHHRTIVEQAATAEGGRVFGTEGDALFVVFDRAPAAIRAAAAAQRGLAAHRWPEGRSLRVRMGIHTGIVTTLKDDFVGLPLHQTARITAAGHGGQVLVSEATEALARDELAGDALALRSLGEHRLKDLAARERLFQLVGSGLDETFPALRTLEVRPNNLPLQLTTFIGRAEIAESARLLGQTRLLTLTGPGGTGKTRLALQLAAETADEFPDGTFFAPLDSVFEPDVVPSAIVAALGLSAASGTPLDLLLDHVRERTMLLVLDNFEQVVDAAPVVTRLLRESPGLKVVVTSRIPLRVSGEQEFPVPPLGLPEATDRTPTAEAAMRSEAVRLFVERATAAQPSFRLTDETAPAVAEIVRRLDGLPLAIELAAARIRVLPVEALRQRLEQALIGVLVGGARDVPLRQQTLRGAIDWSHELLDEADRHLFARFAVFAGGARLTEAEAVCGPEHEIGRDVLDGLSSLAEKSLLRSLLWADEEPRFTMLVTIRDYAAERLDERGETEELRGRHARAYLAMVESCASLLTGEEGRLRADRLQADHDNLRAALEWMIERSETELALRFVTAVWRFWQMRGHLVEAAARIERVFAMPSLAEQSPLLRARAFGAAGGVAYWRADFDETHRWYARALDAARESGDRALIAEALYNIGFAAQPGIPSQEERYRRGRASFEEALALYEELGDEKGAAAVRWALALSTLSSHELELSRRYLEESIRYQRAANDPFGLGWSLHLAGGVDTFERRFDEAAEHLSESLRIFARSGDRSGIVLLLFDIAILAREMGDHPRYWRLLGAADRMREETGVGLTAVEIEVLKWGNVAPPTEDDPDAFREWSAGRDMPLDEAIALALGESDVPPLTAALTGGID